MGVPSADAVFVRAEPASIVRRLTRLSDEHDWWPGARARGGYGWVALDVPSGLRARVRLRADIGPVRAREGFGWSITEGDVIGRAEWWIEAFKDGAIVHYLLDAERGSAPRWASMPRVVRRHRWAIRRGLNALKDLYDRP